MLKVKLKKRPISLQASAFFACLSLVSILVSHSLAAELSCQNLFDPGKSDTHGPSMSDEFSQLVQSGALIGLKDDELTTRGLRTHSGGLCGLGCASSVLLTALDYTGKSSEGETSQADMIQKMILHIEEKFHSNARIASTPSQVASALSQIALEEEVDLVASPLSIESLHGYDQKKLVTPKNTMLILFLESTSAPAGAPGHAVVLSKILPDRKQIRYGDLNFPKVVLSASYEEATDPETGLRTLRLNIPNWNSGITVPWTIYSLVEVQVLERPAPSHP